MSRKKYVDLIECTQRGMIEAVEKLLEIGKNPNEQDERGDYAVLWAAQRNDMKILTMLVDAGASLNVENAYGVTPMDYARKNGNQVIIDYITTHLDNP